MRNKYKLGTLKKTYKNLNLFIYYFYGKINKKRYNVLKPWYIHSYKYHSIVIKQRYLYHIP